MDGLYCQPLIILHSNWKQMGKHRILLLKQIDLFKIKNSLLFMAFRCSFVAVQLTGFRSSPSFDPKIIAGRVGLVWCGG